MKLQEIKEGFKQLWKLLKTLTIEELMLFHINRLRDSLESYANLAERIKKETEEADEFIVKRNQER